MESPGRVGLSFTLRFFVSELPRPGPHTKQAYRFTLSNQISLLITTFNDEFIYILEDEASGGSVNIS